LLVSIACSGIISSIHTTIYQSSTIKFTPTHIKSNQPIIIMSDKEKEEPTDSRGGVRFGTGTPEDEDEYVSALPTLDEERKLALANHDDDGVRARERAEMEDAGRVGGRSRSGGNRNVSENIAVFSAGVQCSVWNTRIDIYASFCSLVPSCTVLLY
jgi:hypothetical protein